MKLEITVGEGRTLRVKCVNHWPATNQLIIEIVVVRWIRQKCVAVRHKEIENQSNLKYKNSQGKWNGKNHQKQHILQLFTSTHARSCVCASVCSRVRECVRARCDGSLCMWYQLKCLCQGPTFALNAFASCFEETSWDDTSTETARSKPLSNCTAHVHVCVRACVVCVHLCVCVCVRAETYLCT